MPLCINTLYYVKTLLIEIVIFNLCLCVYDSLVVRNIFKGMPYLPTGAVANQVVLFYKNALAILGPSGGADNIHETVGTKQYNALHRFLSFKVAYIGCIVYLYQGINAEELQKMGERVAYYQQALAKLTEAAKLQKFIEPVKVTQEALTFTNDVVEGKRKAAKNENEFVYHEEVPEKDFLAEPKPVCLVKALPINFNDPTVSVFRFN